MTTTAGLYSKAFFLNDLKEPILSFPAIAEKVLPPIAKGVFYVGMIATVMSSLHSYIFISATTFGRDIMSRIMNQDDSNNTFNKIGLLISAVLSSLEAYTIPSGRNIWYTVGTLVVPALLIGVISAYFDKLKVCEIYFPGNDKFILCFFDLFCVGLIAQGVGISVWSGAHVPRIDNWNHNLSDRIFTEVKNEN